MHTATYSPDDNKLRIYPACRLTAEEYARVKSAGYRWAPKQEIFVCPAWSPLAEDIAIEMCGSIEDEDKSLTDRAEERAERFDEYHEKRSADAERAHAAVAAIADQIPLGQPILIGHHSERHARKDAERIENGMRKAVKAFETAQYWQRRAAGAIAHAKYKERPDVRARRIKTLEAERRKVARNHSAATECLAFWTQPGLTHEAALQYASTGNGGYLQLKRKDGDRPDFDGRPTAYDALSGSYPNLYAPRTLDEVIEGARAAYPRTIAHCERWLAHLDNRLSYERAMLAEDGGTVADKTGPEKGGAVRCWVYRGGWLYVQKVNKVSVSVLDNYGTAGRNFPRTVPFDKLAGVMTAAEVRAARAEGRLVENESGTGFTLLDTPPAPRRAATEPSESAAKFEAMRESLKAGVRVAVAPQLFPTPVDVAARMVELAEIEPGDRVLEPSAGTGRLLGAMGGRMFAHNPGRGGVVAVEINPQLAQALRREFPLTEVRCADFLSLNDDLGRFERVLLNPPFERGADIAHILHARAMLKPGGRLVAICADGPRQGEKLRPLADHWEQLPAGTFAGTEVRSALLVMNAPGGEDGPTVPVPTRGTLERVAQDLGETLGREDPEAVERAIREATGAPVIVFHAVPIQQLRATISALAAAIAARRIADSSAGAADSNQVAAIVARCVDRRREWTNAPNGEPHAHELEREAQGLIEIAAGLAIDGNAAWASSYRAAAEQLRARASSERPEPAALGTSAA